MVSIWSKARFPRVDERSKGVTETETAAELEAVRSRFQQDYDRLLFSTPVRRLSDKTQVWPMDENDGVRTRLTHSHEVANLARSIGTRVYYGQPGLFGETSLHTVIQPMLSAIGLAHDLGNPPFGHQGETAMGQWFKRREAWIFTHLRDDAEDSLPQYIPEPLHKEFVDFDGNPQTLRLLAKLQTSSSYVGLDLTAATLAAAIKYPVGAANRDKSKPIAKKYGYFESERKWIEWIRSETGLKEGQRHPLTWIMEACDDIAYSVLDVDDAMKKAVISPDDVVAILHSDETMKDHVVIARIQKAFNKAHATKRRPEILRDIKIGYLRAIFIESLINEASAAYVDNGIAINDFTHQIPLMDKSKLCSKLKNIAKQHAFSNPGVLRMEARGAEALDGLMTSFWNAITARSSGEFDNLQARRIGAKNKYVFALISQNYLEDAVRSQVDGETAGSIRYRELRLLTDMLSGMTDTFAIKLWENIRSLNE